MSQPIISTPRQSNDTFRAPFGSHRVEEAFTNLFIGNLSYSRGTKTGLVASLDALSSFGLLRDSWEFPGTLSCDPIEGTLSFWNERLVLACVNSRCVAQFTLCFWGDCLLTAHYGYSSISNVMGTVGQLPGVTFSTLPNLHLCPEPCISSTAKLGPPNHSRIALHTSKIPIFPTIRL